jgi:hypothetical protein
MQPNRIVIMPAGRLVADTRDELTLRELSYPLSITPIMGINSSQHYCCGDCRFCDQSLRFPFA